jgi:hypothetical protein
MRSKFGSLLLLAMVTMPSCVLLADGSAPQMVKPPPGIFFMHVKAPLTQDLNGNPTGDAIRLVKEKDVKYFWDFLITGMSFAWDDATIERIAREGGIQKVSYADYQYMHVLGVFASTTIYVYGT